MARPKKNDDDKTYISFKCKETSDAIHTVNRIINMVANKRMDTNIANCINGLLKTLCSLKRIEELEEKLEELEALLIDKEEGDK